MLNKRQPDTSKQEFREIVLEGVTLVLKSTGGRLIWNKTENKLSLNTNLFPSTEMAQITGLREIGLRMGLRSIFLNGSHVLSDLKNNPELQKIFCWQGLKKFRSKSDLALLDLPNSQSLVGEFEMALDIYALTEKLPQNLSSEISQVFQEFDKQLSEKVKGGSLGDFLEYLFSGNTEWQARKKLFQTFLKPIEERLANQDKQCRQTDSFTYHPPQLTSISEEQELPEEAIRTKVGPKFLGGYYRRRRCRFDPTENQGIGRECLSKGLWFLEDLPSSTKVLETKRPYEGVFTPGQENMLPWNKDGFPLLETLEPKNTFVLLRDTQGGISIEPKEGLTINKPTPFSFDFVLYKCDSNALSDQPLECDYRIEGGDLDQDMEGFIGDLNTQSHLSDVHKGREIANYIRKTFRYPRDKTEIAEIDQIYQSQMQSSVQGLWQKMSEVGVLHCYWANILRNELCHRVGVASAICEGPYVTKDPRWDFAVVEAPGLTEHAWGIVWDPASKEWTHDGQDATPPKEESDEDDEESEDQDTESQEGDFAPTDPPEQLSKEELEKLYEELESSTDNDEEEPEPTPEERAAEQFEREKGIEKSTWDAFKRKTKEWGRQLVPAQNSIDGRASTLEQEDRKLTEMIKTRRKIPQTRFKGPVRQSEGTFLDEPVTAFVGSKAGDPDPVGWKNPQTHLREKVEVTLFEQAFIADLSGSMEDSGAVNQQHQMILQSLYYDWRRNQHLSHSRNKEGMTTPLEWKSQVYSFGGFANSELGVDDELNEKKLCELDEKLAEAHGNSSSGMYQTLQAYKDSLTDEDKKLLREGKKIKMLTITTDGDIPDQENCKKLIQELRELGVVVQGIGFGSGAGNIHEVCREEGDETSSVVLTGITQATQARSQKLKKVIQEYL